MAGLSCCDVWHFSLGATRARVLDEHYPQCQCEPYSLQAEGGAPIDSGDMLARIVTSPVDYDLSTDELLTSKLTSVYSVGLSVIRSGASDLEILDTIEAMVGRQAEGQSLVGAILIDTKSIREMATQDDRWFGVYATDAETKTHHADIAGTFPDMGSKTKSGNERSSRRYKLRDLLAGRLVRAETSAELLDVLRASGI